MFTFWAASNVQILAVSVGVLAIVFGLSLPWAIFAIVVGNAAGGLYMALHSVQGPRLGLPQMMQSRAQFGMYGTALPNIIVVLMYIGYFTSSAILGGQAVASLFHVTTAEGIIIINAFVLLITFFGYDMFHAYNRIVTFLSTGIFVAILVKLLTILPAHQTPGDNSAGTILLAISVFVAWQVTWAPYVSDYSRYMPENTPAAKTFAYTYIGSVGGAALPMCIGAIAAVVAEGRGDRERPRLPGRPVLRQVAVPDHHHPGRRLRELRQPLRAVPHVHGDHLAVGQAGLEDHRPVRPAHRHHRGRDHRHPDRHQGQQQLHHGPVQLPGLHALPAHPLDRDQPDRLLSDPAR